MTPHKIGQTVTKLGIRGNVDGLTRAVLEKAHSSDKTVTAYQYTARAAELIQAAL